MNLSWLNKAVVVWTLTEILHTVILFFFLLFFFKRRKWDFCHAASSGSHRLTFKIIPSYCCCARQPALSTASCKAALFWSHLCRLGIFAITGNDGEVAQHGLSPAKWSAVMFYSILFLTAYIVISFWRVPCRAHDLFITGGLGGVQVA